MVENIVGASLFYFFVSAKNKELKHEQRSIIHKKVILKSLLYQRESYFSSSYRALHDNRQAKMDLFNWNNVAFF